MESRITALKQFEAERARWQHLYRADPLGQVFLSWPWLHAYLRTARPDWTILVLRDGETLVAALPLRVRGIPSPSLPIARELAFATDPVADYQGMLCLPGREPEALPFFADALRTLRWDCAALRDVRDPRVGALLRSLHGAGDELTTTGETRCPRALLPPTFDAYMKRLGSATRFNTLRSTRRLAADLPNYRLTWAGDADIDLHVDAMVRVNHARWGGNLRRARAKYGRLFRAAHDAGCLRLALMWDGDHPFSGGAAFTDPVRGTYNLYQIGYDDAYAKYSPGKGLIGAMIRDAIESGFTVFDFLRGDEAYKASYAGDVVTTTHYRLTRRKIRAVAYDAVQPLYTAVKTLAARVVYGPGRTV